MFASLINRKQQFSPRQSGFRDLDKSLQQMSVLQLAVQKARYLSPTHTASNEKFDFGCFIKFLIQLGIKCFPGVSDQTQAVLILIENLVLPLLRQTTDRSLQQANLSKLITLVNQAEIVDFMSDLHQVLQPIYHNYTVDSKGLMLLREFIDFAKDHDIFPSNCSKQALLQIFQALSKLRETLNPTTHESQIKRDLSELEISFMSPSGIDKQSGLGKIDQNLFTEAVTLCALHTSDPSFIKQIKSYKGHEPSSLLTQACLSRCF